MYLKYWVYYLNIILKHIELKYKTKNIMPEKNIISKHKVGFCVTTCVLIFIGVLLFLIMFPLSFSYINYNEIGFEKNVVTNIVYTDTVFEPGRYFYGVGYGSFTFPRTYQEISFTGDELLVFSENGLEFPIEVFAYYKLTAENLEKIYNDFGTSYNKDFKDIIKAAIKNKAPDFTVDEYITNRTLIDDSFLTNINKELEDLHLVIDTNRFILGKINFPNKIADKFLETAVQELENEIADLQRDVDLINKETEKQVEQIRANITIIDVTSTAEANAIIENANSASFGIVQEGEGTGISYLINALNMTTSVGRDELLELLSVLDNNSDNTKLFVGDLDALVGTASPA